jgi:hypothetical protein
MWFWDFSDDPDNARAPVWLPVRSRSVKVSQTVVAPAVVGGSCWWSGHAHLFSGVVAGWPSGAGASGERVLNRRTSRRWKGALPRGLGSDPGGLSRSCRIGAVRRLPSV